MHFLCCVCTTSLTAYVSSCLLQEMLTQNYETYYICTDTDIHLDRLIFMYVCMYTG